MNISGVLVMTPPDNAEKLIKKLEAYDGVEIHASDKGKLVVTIEGDNNHVLADRVMEIQNLDNVLSASVVYQHEEENVDYPIDPEYLSNCDCSSTISQETTL